MSKVKKVFFKENSFHIELLGNMFNQFIKKTITVPIIERVNGKTQIIGEEKENVYQDFNEIIIGNRVNMNGCQREQIKKDSILLYLKFVNVNPNYHTSLKIEGDRKILSISGGTIEIEVATELQKEIREETPTEKEQRIIKAINNDFSLKEWSQVEFSSSFVLNDGQAIGSWEINENTANVFEAIKQSIKNNPNQFNLSKLCFQNYQEDGQRRPLSRSWWSPIIKDKNDFRMFNEIYPDIRSEWDLGERVVYISGTRKIEHRKGGTIHPSALTAEQYEELKNLIPGACQVKGCCNNYPDNPYDLSNKISGVSVKNGKCLYHSSVDKRKSNKDVIEEHNRLLAIIAKSWNSKEPSYYNNKILPYISELKEILTLIEVGILSHENEYIKANQLMKKIINLAEEIKNNSNNNGGGKTVLSEEEIFIFPIPSNGSEINNQSDWGQKDNDWVFQNVQTLEKKEDEQPADNFFLPLVISLLPAVFLVSLLAIKIKKSHHKKNKIV